MEKWFEFAWHVAVAGLGSLPIILIGSAIGAALGCSVVVAERHSVPFGRLAPIAAASLLLLLFYPKQISQASLSYLLTLLMGGKFAQSVWGLMIVSIPPAAGMAYLLFSTTIALSDYVRLPATFIKNSGRAPFLRTCLIAMTPLRQPLALTIALLSCTIGFQAAMLGRSPASTFGTQIQLQIRGTELSDLQRIVLLGTAVAILLLVLLSVRALIALLLNAGTVVALEADARAGARWLPSNAWLVKSFIGLATAMTLVVSGLLHVFLVLRLLGLAHGLCEFLGLPVGSLEETWPSFTGIGRLLENVGDPAVVGAASGFTITMVVWFMRLARNWRPPSSEWALLVPVGFAGLAFLPSGFAGSLSLALPGLGRILEFLLFTWGALAAGGLASLLVVTHLVADDAHRYANLKRMRGQTAAVRQFIREYWLVAAGILFAVMLGNIFDSGYRDQMGMPSLGTKFIDRQGSWDPERRALALMIMVAAVFATWILTRNVSRSNEPARSAK